MSSLQQLSSISKLLGLVPWMLGEGRSTYMKLFRILLTTLVLVVTAVSSIQGAVENRAMTIVTGCFRNAPISANL